MFSSLEENFKRLKIYKEECEKNRRAKNTEIGNYVGTNNINSFTFGDKFNLKSALERDRERKQSGNFKDPSNQSSQNSQYIQSLTKFEKQPSAKNIEINHISTKLNQKHDYRQKSEHLVKIPKNIDTTAESLDKSGNLKDSLKIESEKKINPINLTKCINPSSYIINYNFIYYSNGRNENR